MSKLLIFFVATGIFLGLEEAYSDSNAVTITVIATFDYPGTGNSTEAYGINNSGDIAGYYFDSSGTVAQGFTRRHVGKLSRPIVEPNDAKNMTFALGINASREVDGYFLTASNAREGFFLNGRTFSEYQFNGAYETALYALNDVGDFAGYERDATTFHAYAFANIGGTVSVINLPSSTVSYAFGMNNLGQVVGGYLDSVSFHG